LGQTAAKIWVKLRKSAWNPGMDRWDSGETALHLVYCS